MFLRSKVILIRGCCKPPLSKRLTIASLQRINVDHMAIAMFLRNPENLSPEVADPEDLFRPDVISLLGNLIDHLENSERHYLLISEYGSLITERGQGVRVVEGSLLDRSWIYIPIRAMHKHLGQHVTEVDLNAKINHVRIDGREVLLESALEILSVPLQS